MSVIMMTSIDTLYEVNVQDVNPINHAGAPKIDAQFNGLTQMALQSPCERSLDRAQAEASFKQQQKYLHDAAYAAVGTFNPINSDLLRFRATLKLHPITGQLQAFSHSSESSGLAYALALALAWGERKKLLGPIAIPTLPIFTTGAIPVDGHIKPIGYLLKKVRYACNYIEKIAYNEDNTTLTTLTSKIPANTFYIIVPHGNKEQLLNDSALCLRVSELGGKIIFISHLSEALQFLLGDRFDGGTFTHINNDFSGLQSIIYEQRHLFMGREALVDDLYKKSQDATQKRQILNVTGISGSGKSSAVMAGLMPTLFNSGLTFPTPNTSDNTGDSKNADEKSNESNIHYASRWIVTRPSEHNDIPELLSALLSSICDQPSLISHNLHLPPESLAAVIKQSMTEAHPDNTASTTSLQTLWVIDQYEEVFTHQSISPSEAQKLFSFLAVLALHLPVTIITVLRTEYLSLLGDQACTDFILPRHIPAKDIERIINLQLQYHRLSTESADKEHATKARQQHLDNRIKNDAIGKPLTSVSYLLQQMHQQMIDEDPASTQLTHAHYEAVGGINGVMAQQAEIALAEGLSHYSPTLRYSIIHGFFEALIGIDNDQQPVIRHLNNNDISQYPKSVNTLIQAFMSKGLIIDCGKGTTPKIKLAHDTLITIEDIKQDYVSPTVTSSTSNTVLNVNQDRQPTSWQRLATWFYDNQPFLTWRHEVDPLLSKWQQNHSSRHHHLLTQHQTLLDAKRLSVITTTANEKLKQYLKTSYRKQLKKKYLPWLGLLAIVIVVSTGTWYQYCRVSTQYTAFIGERYGIPFGVGQLTLHQKNSRENHYQLRYQGKQLVSASKHNSQHTLLNDVNRDNAARWDYYYTESGDLFRENSFSKNGKPLTIKTYEFTPDNSLAQVRFKFHGTHNSLGNIAYQASRFEGNHNSKSQITQHRLLFNTQGLIEKKLFYNNNETPVKDASGAYGLHYYYNEQALIIRVEYIGIGGKSISIDGAHAREYQRNSIGSITSKSWIDHNDQLINNASGYARTTTTYDTYGNLLEKAYYDVNKLATVHKQGFYRATARYNKEGHQIERQYLDNQGKLTAHQWGFARMTLDYDSRGNAIEWQYFDANNQPTLRNKHFSRITFTYDALGNRTEEKYFDVDNKPALHPYGYTSFRSKYDSRSNLLEETYFSIDNKPTLHKKGYARVSIIYDKNNNAIQRSHYGVNNELVFNQYKYAYYTAIFDRQNNRTDVFFYGIDKQRIQNAYGFSHVATTYDKQGNKTDIKYYDDQGIPTLHTDGFSHIHVDYYQNGYSKAISYFGINDKAILSKQGYARTELLYDERGNRIEKKYFGIDHQAAVNHDGVSRQVIRYDKRDNPIEWKYFDVNDTPTTNKKGYARISATYNKQDTLMKLTHFDIFNQVILPQ
jgi:YD repeat-containing protein